MRLAAFIILALVALGVVFLDALRFAYKQLLYGRPEQVIGVSLPATSRGAPTIRSMEQAARAREIVRGVMARAPVTIARVGEPIPAERVSAVLDPGEPRWTRVSGPGWVSHRLDLEPARPSGRRLIYQEGHFGAGDCRSTLCLDASSAALIRQARRQGYAVSVLWLPWQGPNGDATVEEARQAVGGDDAFLASLMLPIREAIQDEAETTLVGLSYGGSVVPLYAAADPRIARAYEVDGNPPFSCWNLVACALQVGKPEPERPYRAWSFDAHAPLRGRLNQLDLYLLAALDGPFVQIANRGYAGNFIEGYASDLRKAAAALGGCYRGLLVEHDRHEITPEAAAIILGDDC